MCSPLCLSVDVTSLQGFLIENHSKRSSVFGLQPSIVAWTPLQRVWVCGVTKDVSPRCFTSQQHRKLTTSFNGFFFPSHHVRLLCEVSVCRLLKVLCFQKSLRVMEKSPRNVMYGVLTLCRIHLVTPGMHAAWLRDFLTGAQESQKGSHGQTTWNQDRS